MRVHQFETLIIDHEYFIKCRFCDVVWRAEDQLLEFTAMHLERKLAKCDKSPVKQYRILGNYNCLAKVGTC
jgi:hypothetical protein